MCGSGTLAIEAALMTTDTAPGLLRYKMDDLGDVGRPSQSLPRSVLLDTEASQELWATVWDDAQKRDKRLEYVSEGRPIVASVNDLHPGAIELAIKSAAAANVHKLISFSCRDAELFEPKSCRFILTNPPWDLRLEGAADSWRKLGSLSRRLFSPQGGMLWALSGNPAVVREIGLKPTKSVPISGPTADMRLLCYDIAASK
jgi:23S rRNA G2445 N2-methylase RlmL